MKKKVIYTDAPKDTVKSLLEGKRVYGLIPPPEQLIKKNPKTKVTITLNDSSVEFFKEQAKKNDTKYQVMINEVLDKYVKEYRKIIPDDISKHKHFTSSKRKLLA